MQTAVIVGGGIGGLAAALAIGRAGWQVDLLEQASAFGEVGAGLQLGPNATRVLESWGLLPALEAVACEPDALRVRDAADGRTLGRLPLGASMRSRYSAPYLTVHRADLHRVLLDAAQQSGARLRLQVAIKNIAIEDHLVRTTGTFGSEIAPELAAEALIGADGLWSVVRQQVWSDGPPQSTGHVAWRALLDPAQLPEGVSARDITVWLGPHMHMVLYPVRGGALMNLVLVLAGQLAGDPQDWSHAADPKQLQPLLRQLDASAAGVIAAAPSWLRWALHVRPPVPSAAAMARGRFALLGDAAHAMRPYLAQGGAMALEDAWQLAASVQQQPGNVPAALQHYASHRWQRNARVQRAAQRNGSIFHARGAVRLGRDIAMRVLSPALLDSPWLYGGPPAAT